MTDQRRTTIRARFPRSTILVVMMMCCYLGCSRSTEKTKPIAEDPSPEIVTVCVVNYPLQYFAQRIGGDHVRVVFLAPSDEDPAFWRPDADAITKYQQADLIFLNGASYAKWIKTVTLRESKLVDTSASLVDQYIEVQDAVTHAHGPGAQHAHAGIAFTTWLDPKLAIAQAEAIQKACRNFCLSTKRLSNEFFQPAVGPGGIGPKARCGGGRQDRSVNRFLSSRLSVLTRRYDLNAKSVHWEPDAVPSAKMWDELASMLRDHPASTMIWEGNPIEENVKRAGRPRAGQHGFRPLRKRAQRGRLPIRHAEERRESLHRIGQVGA